MKISDVIVLPVVLSLLLCGCETYNDRNEKQAEGFLEDYYDRDFTFKGNGETAEERDKLYIFEDEEGLECHFYMEYSQGVFNGSYRQFEDYQAMYFLAHPELYEDIQNGKWQVTVDYGDEDYSQSGLLLKYNSYEDIENSVEFVYSKLSEIDRVFKGDGFSEVSGINSVYPTITFQKNGDSAARWWDCQIKMPLNEAEMTDKESVINALQNDFVENARQNGEAHLIPEEILNENPVSCVKNITYNGEIAINTMLYLEEYNEYSLYCEFDELLYTDELGALLHSIGWEVEYVADIEMVWRKNDRCVSFSTDVQWENIEVSFNGESYNMLGEIGCSGYKTGFITLTETDLKRLFGIEIRFDQLNETGEVISAE